jgi:hypothetical protein
VEAQFQQAQQGAQPVERDHSLPDAVQHRLPLVQQRRDNLQDATVDLSKTYTTEFAQKVTP